MARARGCRAAGLLVAAVFVAASAFAQDVVVDGHRITAEDIEQRSRFDQLATHKAPSREQVIDELSNEASTLRQARQHGVDVSDAAVEQAYADMAARMHLTAQQLTQGLAQQGVNARTLKGKIRADLARMQFLRSRGPAVPSR